MCVRVAEAEASAYLGAGHLPVGSSRRGLACVSRRGLRVSRRGLKVSRAGLGLRERTRGSPCAPVRRAVWTPEG